MASEPEGEGAPESASCAEHPERDAQFVCPRCGSFVCAQCWRASSGRCAACLERDPHESVAAIPWEQKDRPFAFRYLATLTSALSPLRSAPAFARSDVRSAQRFALISAVPFALLAGIIPFTRTLRFLGSMKVELIGKPSQLQIALDVLTAAGVQLSITMLELLALLLPFVSLVRAYAPGRQHAAARVLYYRAWMSPFALLLLYVVYWLLPIADAAGTPAPEGAARALLIVLELGLRVFVPVLLFMAMSATARVCGLGPGMATVVVAVPVVLLFMTQGMLGLGLQQLFPELVSEAAKK